MSIPGVTDWPPTLESNSFPNTQPTVLLATNHLFGWSGSETLLLTLAEGLQEAGCKLTIYARHLDYEWATQQVGDKAVVTSNLEHIRACHFDLAHVQHSSSLMDVRAVFPTLPIIVSSLGVLPFLEQPAPFDCGVARYLAISEEVRDNLVSRGIPTEQIDIIRNLVSERCFSPTETIRLRPERILVISNKLDDTRKAMLQAAARSIGASIRFVGGTHGTLPQTQLAVAINDADVVVSLGRGVVEAMLCGRVPLVFDINGGDGLVIPSNMDELGAFNFSGRCHRLEYTIEDLVVEIGKYRREYGVQLRERALVRFGLKANLPRVLSLYAKVSKEIPHPDPNCVDTASFCSRLAREDFLFAQLPHQRTTLALQEEISRIKSTVSWRITKPLRGLWNLLCVRQSPVGFKIETANKDAAAGIAPKSLSASSSDRSTLSGQQQLFLNDEIFQLTLSGALQRASVYAENITENDRSRFHKTLKSELSGMIPCYTSLASDSAHAENIVRLSCALTKKHSMILQQHVFRIGVAQKALNLYLKYQWCLGRIPEPPHCPFDARILKQIPGCESIRWTQIEMIEEYLEIVQRAKKVAEPLTLAEWELRCYSQSQHL